MEKVKMIINRVKLRNEKLHNFCATAKTFRHKTINKNIIIFCYGIKGKEECKKCIAWLGVVKK
jgi:hypothetical protein